MSSYGHLTRRKKVVIIGGGATGTGAASQAAEAGFEVVLIDRGKLGSGTTGNFHGMLHSGGRYAVNDVSVAAECYQENQRLRQLVPSAIIDTGGMFVACDDTEASHADLIMSSCRQAGIPLEEITVERALQLEPYLSRGIKRAFLTADAFIDGAKLIAINRRAGQSSAVPVKFIENHTASGFERNNRRITAVMARDTRSGETIKVDCDFVINAAGVWSGEVAALAEVSLKMIFDKGTMIAFKDRFANRVLNRARSENDGDLVVPDAQGRSVLGTTARVVSHPDNARPSQEEIDLLIDEGSAMIPSLATAEASRVYTGVRPLFDTSGLLVEGQTRAVSRSYHLLDHADQSVDNFLSIVGGKVTLYRRMAEDTVNLLNAKIT